jgi:acyl-coenzyme A thioesterase PaaI-like protein
VALRFGKRTQASGALQGGILCDIANAAMGMALASTLVPNESFTTIDLKISFFRPVSEFALKAEGRSRGGLGYVECENNRRKRPAGG